MKTKNTQYAFILFAAAILMLLALPGCSCDKQENHAGGIKPNVQKTDSGVYITDPFETLYSALGPGSTGDERDRKNIWASYRGKFVRWTAKMGAMKLMVDKSVAAELIHIRTKGGVEAVCSVNFAPDEASKIMDIPPGTEVVYQARLASYTTFENKTVFFLKNGKIIKTNLY